MKLILALAMTMSFNVFANGRLKVVCLSEQSNKTSFTFPSDEEFYAKEGYKDRKTIRIGRKSASVVRVAEKSVGFSVSKFDAKKVYKFPKSALVNNDGSEFEVKVSYTSVDQWTPRKYSILCVVN